MPEPLPLTIVRAVRADHTPETELATIERAGDRVILTLDDGQEINANAAELLAAVGFAA